MTDSHEKTAQEVLEDALNSFDEALRFYWQNRLEEDDVPHYFPESVPKDQWYEELRKMGKDAFRLAEGMSGPEFLENYELSQAIESTEIYRGIPMTALQVQAARRFAYDLPELADRVSRLAYSVLHNHPPPRVRGFMRLLGRSYVAGHRSEVFILCRAVLESALKDRLAQVGVKKIPKNIQRLIDTAAETPQDPGPEPPEVPWESNTVIHPDFKHHAHLIRVLGNGAIHEEVDEDVDLFEVLLGTIYLVGRAFADERVEPPGLFYSNPNIPHQGAHQNMAADHFSALGEHVKNTVVEALEANGGSEAPTDESRAQTPPVISPRLGGSYGNPSADVVFLTMNPTPHPLFKGNPHQRIGFFGGVEWDGTQGDHLFRETLVLHGLKDPPWEGPLGWHCYVTSLVKEADFVGQLGGEDQPRPEKYPEFWRGVLNWELNAVGAWLVVPIGEDARLTWKGWNEEERILPKPPVPTVGIPHASKVASQSQHQLGPEPFSKYRESMGEVVLRLRELKEGLAR